MAIEGVWNEGAILDGRIMAKGSTRVIIVALTGNLAIALAKFIARGFPDRPRCSPRRSTRWWIPATRYCFWSGRNAALVRRMRDPLGHGMETYFWSFIVALMVFLLGGVLSL